MQIKISSQLLQSILLFLITLVFSIPLIAAQSDSMPWDAWEAVDVETISDDNSGSTVEMSNVDGTPALMITPSSSSEETKIAVPFVGIDLAPWADAGAITFEVYLPETNAINTNNFFLGMADVTNGAFNWVAGVFGEADAASGWATVTFPLDSAMRDLTADHHYELFLSFFHTDDSSTKVPLTEPIYLGGASLTTLASGNTSADETYHQQVDILLSLDDDELVDAIARETFDFFWLEANPETGLFKDRSTPDSVASIAAVGFGLAAIPIGVDRGWIDYDEGHERALTMLQTFVSGGVQGEHGFFYHFVTMNTGERVWNSEVSSIDTALLVAGALVAGQYFEGTEVQTLADQLYENVEWHWMLGGGDLLRMGWKPEPGFINAAWDHFDESMILYVLAIGSPTHPIPAESWDMWDRPVNVSGGYIYLPGEPLFVYQYPLAFLNLQGMEDPYANYWNNTTLACRRNRDFAVANSDHFTTYQNGVWGISASDGPSGYRAYGASEVNHDGTIAPYAVAACLPFTPEIALEGMRAILSEYGVRAWHEYGFVSAINEDEGWFSRDHIGIDQGDILLMLANSQDGFVWDLFMANPNIQNALDAMGFVKGSGDYAVTPAYLADVTGQ